MDFVRNFLFNTLIPVFTKGLILPEPMLTQMSDGIWHMEATMSQQTSFRQIIASD